MELLNKIINYCVENKTWIFSGIGVTAITVFVSLFINKKSNKTNSVMLSTKAGNDAKSINISGNNNKLDVK